MDQPFFTTLEKVEWQKKYAPFVIQKNNLTIAYFRRTQPHFATIGASVRSSIMLRLEILGVWCYKRLDLIIHFFQTLYQCAVFKPALVSVKTSSVPFASSRPSLGLTQMEPIGIVNSFGNYFHKF